MGRPGYVSEGFVILAGRQKLGKTWLALEWAIAVASGGVAMGSIPCDQGDVLYVDLENGKRRMQRRFNALYSGGDLPDLNRLVWGDGFPQLNDAFFKKLESWRRSVSDPRLVVIDVLQRIKPVGSFARNSYENDYSIWSSLQEWATEHSIAVVGLHHTRKGGADDPLEALSGSNGLSACGDTTIVLDSDQNGKTLYLRGRDVEEKEIAIVFDGGHWTILGEAQEVRRSDERSAIIDALRDNGEPMTPTQVAAALGTNANNTKQLLFKMARSGEVHKVGKGKYWLDPGCPP
jgi:RecA-family ATPase